MSIRRRLTLSLILTMLLLLGGAGAVLDGYLRVELTARYDESLLAKAQTLQGILRIKGKGKVELDFAEDAMPEFDPSRTAEYFQLWSAQGRSIERSDSLGSGELLHPDAMMKEPRYIDVPLPDGRAGRMVTIRAMAKRDDDDEAVDGGKGAGARGAEAECIIAVARERGNLDRTLATIAWAIGGGVVALAFGIGALVPALVNRNLRPLEDMARQASKIDPQSLEMRFTTANMPAELLPICARLNDSLNKLQAAFERERRFSADVAHELRTPISELKVLAEVALKYPQDPAGSRRSFQDSLDVARQMEAIVGTLLEMMKDDSPLPPEELQRIDLASAADEIWNALQTQAAAKNLTFHNTLDHPFAVATQNIIVRRILHNVLGNTAEYATPASVVECHGRRQDGKAIIRICNATSDLDPTDLHHMAEPFWRRDSSRTGSVHSGLGLSLVSSYARRLGIKLSWSLPQAGRFELTLEFPSNAMSAESRQE